MIFRVEKTKNYTVMGNYHLREKKMSLKAKGLLSWMLSNDDEWDYSIKGIVANCKENETAIQSTLKELQEFGYLQIRKLNPCKDNPKIHYEYVIHEIPQGPENQGLDFQGIENPAQINTKERNTNKEDNLSKDKLLGNFGKRPARKENLYDKCFKEIVKFTNNPAIQDHLTEYLKVWITLKDKHPSYEGWKRILNKLKNEFIQEDWIAVIKQSIAKRYATFCPVMNNFNKSQKKFDEHIDRDGRYDNVSHVRQKTAF